MTREEKERAIDTGYYHEIDLDAAAYQPVALQKFEDRYVLQFKDSEALFGIEIPSTMMSRLVRGLRAHRLEEIEKNEKAQPKPVARTQPS